MPELLKMPKVHDKTCRFCSNDAGMATVLAVEGRTAMPPRGSSSRGFRYSLTDTSGRSIGASQGFCPNRAVDVQAERDKQKLYEHMHMALKLYLRTS